MEKSAGRLTAILIFYHFLRALHFCNQILEIFKIQLKSVNDLVEIQKSYFIKQNNSCGYILAQFNAKSANFFN
jgi:hypothetical protein